MAKTKAISKKAAARIPVPPPRVKAKTAPAKAPPAARVERIPAAPPEPPARAPRPGVIEGQPVQDTPLNGTHVVGALPTPPHQPAPEAAPAQTPQFVRPVGQAFLAAIDSYLPEIQAIVAAAVNRGAHPEPLLYAFAVTIANYADLVAPPATGDDLVDRICVTIRNGVQNVRARRAAESAAKPAEAP